MPTISNPSSEQLAQLECVRYFPRQLITADDMTTEQDYFREKLRRHNRMLHGWGVVYGCAVTAVNDKDWQVQVGEGYVLTPRGDEIYIPEDVMPFDLAGDWMQPYDPCLQLPPCPPATRSANEGTSVSVYLAVCYTECETRPVRLHPAGCGCDEAACEYSRIRDSFVLVRLTELPASHQIAPSLKLPTSPKQAVADGEDWRKDYHEWLQKLSDEKKEKEQRVPRSCPTYYDENCVVLARIVLPPTKGSPITKKMIF